MNPPASPAVVDPPAITPADAADLREAGSFFSQGELQLTLIIFVFGLIAMIVFYLLTRTERATLFVLRIFVVIILVFGTLIVVSSSYSTQQIAPVVGFFGTIAGYLLGRSERQNDPDR